MQWVNPELLPWKRHSDLAILIVQTSAKYAPDTIAGNFLQDSVRHVSNLAGKLRRTPEQVFISWAWEMCSRLRSEFGCSVSICQMVFQKFLMLLT